jgi:vancomycin permeability regulator SanA
MRKTLAAFCFEESGYTCGQNMIMWRVLLFVFLGFVVWIGLHSAWTVLAGVRSQPRAADVAVVLGTRVERSGIPSRRLRERLDRAYELYTSQLVRTIIVSGGLGREGYEEADVMRDYLVSRGIPDSAIFLDQNGYDTYESARNAKSIMDARNLESAVVVSHYYHLARAVLTFRRFGISEVSAAAVEIPPAFRDTWNVLREFAAFYFYLVRDYAAT